MAMPDTVGFIGLGAMGGPRALNLVKHGFSLVAHEIDPAKAELWRGVQVGGGA
jgi:3-hydroxyisobutyrate dehydrogenase-like beta-hydroxyacid dehydrogenase